LKLIRSVLGFTLIELVMVILLLAILAAVAIPNFQDFRTEAKNAAAYGALGGLRSAVSVARAAISLKEDQTTPPYPTVLEMQANSFDGSHPVMNALAAANKRIMDGAAGIPVNPWSLSTVPLTQQNSFWDCTGMAKGIVRSTADEVDFGWCYNPSNGNIWANSDKNGTSLTENNF
jgi:prepilin-type N-terminal cleavage/methylation domain-containing protein